MILISRILALVALAVFIPSFATLANEKAATVTIENAYAYATTPTRENGAAFLKITNAGDQPDRLTAVRTDAAASAELHDHIHENDIMKMRRVDGFDIPAGESLMLQPMGPHVMLMGLTRQLKVGETFPLTLVFEKAGEQAVTVKIIETGTAAP